MISLVITTSLAIATTAGASPPKFVDVTRSSGLHFTHSNGHTDSRHMPATMGAGVCLFDADGDGKLDVYLVDGGPPSEHGFAPGPPDRLFMNRGGMRFEDATESSGLGDRGFGMGCTVGDVDADGDQDLYVTNFDGNTLWKNDGSGHFTEIGAQAGVRVDRWSVSAAFGDLNGDSHLDLYVVTYVDFGFENHKYCGDLARGLRAYCHPDVYDGLPPALLLGDGNFGFEDKTDAAGIRKTTGKGLGVILSDLDGDGDADIYSANDSTVNYMLRNDGGGHFDDISLVSGAGYNMNGAAEAGMGVDSGDVDGDGDLDIFVTNLDMETNTLYRAVAPMRFRDVSIAAKLALPSLRRVGFGTELFDYDSDGDLDLLVVNGHILDNVAEFKDNVDHAQATQLFANDGSGTFSEVSATAGPFFTHPIVGRGLAVGDLDGDLDLDAVITTNGGAAFVLENRTAGGNSLVVELIGTKSNRDGYGARLTMTAGDRKIVREAKSSSSYLSQGDKRVYFGLGAANSADRLEVRWPSGTIDTLEGVPAGLVEVREGGHTTGVTPPDATPAGTQPSEKKD